MTDGTAKKLKTQRYQFAGKTGTAQIDYVKFNRKKNIKHRASFVGYFPAKNPVYSCIVMITNPRQNGIHGGEVAGPVFREIADKSFATRVELHKGINERAKPRVAEKRLPNVNIGDRYDMQKVLSQFEVPYTDLSEKTWAVIQTEGDTLNMYSRTIPEEGVPKGPRGRRVHL